MPSARILRELHSMLTDGGPDVSAFIDLGGITLLARFIETLARNPPATYVPHPQIKIIAHHHHFRIPSDNSPRSTPSEYVLPTFTPSFTDVVFQY